MIICLQTNVIVSLTLDNASFSLAQLEIVRRNEEFRVHVRQPMSRSDDTENARIFIFPDFG